MSHCLLRGACARFFPIALAAAIVPGIERSAAAQTLHPLSSASSGERELSLAELLAHAEGHAPALLISKPRRGYASAARAGAEPWLHQNPTLEFGIGPRFSGGSERDFDFVASVAQPVEIAGQRGLRLSAASRMGERLAAEATLTDWELRRDITLLFRTAVVARERALIEERSVRFAEEMVGIARRRLGAGEATAVDLHLAETDLAQARQAKLAAEQDVRTLRIRLAEITGWPIEHPPNVPVGIPEPAPVPALAAVLERAGDQHPELKAHRAAVAEARARAELADRDAWPTPVLGVQVAREGSAGSPANYIALGTLATPLPFWQLNREERARSRVDRDVAEAEEKAAAEALRARIARAHAELTAAAERLALFATTLAPQLERSLDLLRRGLEAGELPLLEVAVARERFLSAQRDVLGIYADYYRAQAELEAALGAELPTAAAVGGAR
jgi:cobalt-zinc-cadmium efflux system outer membrane protein